MVVSVQAQQQSGNVGMQSHLATTNSGAATTTSGAATPTTSPEKAGREKISTLVTGLREQYETLAEATALAKEATLLDIDAHVAENKNASAVEEELRATTE